MSTVNVLVTRRAALFGGGALVTAASVGSLPAMAAQSLAEGSKAAAPSAQFKLGSAKVATLLDGAVNAKEPQKTFGMNQSAEAFDDASKANFIPADAFKAYFTPTVVQIGGETILFDTGVGSGGLPARGNLSAALAGVELKPEDIDVVVLTHMHPDHIGGLMQDGAPAFKNARYVTGADEFDFWAKMDPEANGVAKLFSKNVKPLADKMSFIKGGDSVVPGIEAVEAFGHTPGHMVYLVESDGKQALLAADTANHYVWSLAYPDWEVRFDMDKGAAAETRKKIFGMVASDRIPFVGYHMPFPAAGYVEAVGSGFRYVPVSYQLDM
ncbi:MBL fold metallo-hydrolase [Rhodobacteraceae bacterium RKSG542]|uniref:MBL fold metallo-hydrolase n=1 Tax=Pseudovibrio flavus TaxID=2529854 RepID=UPI0012BD147A|nr:MBL fold metallo-hydrolase [Pseudovibrio flavus]MTI16632.1 MBL fold metallo-hydrolase [Pseudovibrio flavus]